MTTGYRHAQASASFLTRSQDNFKVIEHGDFLVIVVADGGGGMREGSAASRCLVSVVEAAVNEENFALEDPDAWLLLFQQADAALAANSAGETTGVVVVLGPRGLVGVSTGNSEAWLVGHADVDKLTLSQHTGQRLGGRRATPTTFCSAVPANDCVLLVASDGLFKFASRDAIAGIVRAQAVDLAAPVLVELVRLRTGKVTEDVAVVLVGSAIAEAPSS
jgi:serine/threonine protein phosphatase PrpC